uniref:Uncharacterized protein n=1 Tax=Globodera pallida TaxID=36090 RepID=A0A183C8S3_GLOPA
MASDDDGVTEFEILSIRLYDECPCVRCDTVRFWYIIQYQSETRIPTVWGTNQYLKDEGCFSHAGFSQGRLLKAVFPRCVKNGVLDVELARKIEFAKNGHGNENFTLFAISDNGTRVPFAQIFPDQPAVDPLPDNQVVADDNNDQMLAFEHPVRVPTNDDLVGPVEAAVDETSVLVIDESQLSLLQQQQHQQLQQPLTSAFFPVSQQFVRFDLPPLMNLTMQQPSTSGALHGAAPVPLCNITNNGGVNALAYSPLSSSSSPSQLLTLSNTSRVHIPHKKHLREVWATISSADKDRCIAAENRPSTAGSLSSSSSTTSSSSTSDRDQMKMRIIRMLGKRCADENCQKCSENLQI